MRHEDRQKLGKMRFSPRAITRAEPILELVHKRQFPAVEREVALLFIAAMKEVRAEEITTREADEYFTILGIILEPEEKAQLSREAQEILFVGELLHEPEKEVAADVEKASQLALQILLRKPAQLKPRTRVVA